MRNFLFLGVVDQILLGIPEDEMMEIVMVMTTVNEHEVQAQIMTNLMIKDPKQFMIKEHGKERMFKLNTTEVEAEVVAVVVDFPVMKLIVKRCNEATSSS